MAEPVPVKLDPPAKMALRGLLAGGPLAVILPIAGVAALVVLALVACVIALVAALLAGVAAVSPLAILLCPAIWATRPEFLRKLKEVGEKEATAASDEAESKAKAAEARERATQREAEAQERATQREAEAQERAAQWEAEAQERAAQWEAFRKVRESQQELQREARENARKAREYAQQARQQARQSQTHTHAKRFNEDAFREMFKDLFPSAHPVDKERQKILKRLRNHIRFVNDKTGATKAERDTHEKLGNELIQRHNITTAELRALEA